MVDYNGFKIRVAFNHDNHKVNVRIENERQEIVDDFEVKATPKEAILLSELLIDKGCYSQGQTTLDNVF